MKARIGSVEKPSCRTPRSTWLAAACLALAAGAHASDDDVLRCQALAAQIPDTALEHCERALKDPLAPGVMARVHISRAVAWRSKGDAAHALEDLNQALKLDPDNADAHVMRAVARQHMGDLTGALSDCDEAVRLRPDAAAYGARGDVRRRQGDLDGAIADYGQVIRLDPQRAFGLRVRAAASLEKGDFESAEADYRQAQHLDPGARAGLRRLGIAQFLARHFADSARTLAEAANRDPADVHAQLWRYLALRRSNQAEAAQAALAQADAAAGADAWPAPLIAWLRTAGDRGSLAPLPDTGAPTEREPRRCDSDFYAGELILTRPDLDNRAAQARAMLKAALVHCPPDSYAAFAARSELRALASTD